MDSYTAARIRLTKPLCVCEIQRVAGRKWQRDEASVVSALLTCNKVCKEEDEAVGDCAADKYIEMYLNTNTFEGFKYKYF